MGIPEDSDLAQKVKQRLIADEKERDEIAKLVLQKARLVSDDDEQLHGSQRLNKAGLNVRRAQLDAQKQQAQPGPPTRSLGKKF